MSGCEHRFEPMRAVCKRCGRTKLDVYTEGTTPEMIADARAKFDRDAAFEDGRLVGQREASSAMFAEIDRVFA
mgnify:CR=1 FL=1